MRFLRSLARSSWIVVIIIAVGGFAAFSAVGHGPSSGVQSTPIGLAEPSARASAFVLAAALDYNVDLGDRTAPLQPGYAAGPDAIGDPELAVVWATTTTTTTTTAPPPTTTTTTRPRRTTTTTTTTRPPATTTTAPPATTTTAPPATTTTTTTAGDESAGESTTTTTAVEGGARNVEEWRPLVARYFPADRVDEALSVMKCESNGDPLATNRYSGAAGLFQFMPGTWAWSSEGAGFAGASVYDPEANVASAAWLVDYSIRHGHRDGAWGHWVCQP